jgi:hypothetical protein
MHRRPPPCRHLFHVMAAALACFPVAVVIFPEDDVPPLLTAALASARSIAMTEEPSTGDRAAAPSRKS